MSCSLEHSFAAGAPKPALGEMRAFAAMLDAIDAARCARADTDTEDGTCFAVLASHAAEPLTVKPVLAAPGALTTLDGENADGGITMDPFGISVVKVTEHPGRLADPGPAQRGVPVPTVPGPVACWPHLDHQHITRRGTFSPVQPGVGTVPSWPNQRGKGNNDHEEWGRRCAVT